MKIRSIHHGHLAALAVFMLAGSMTTFLWIPKGDLRMEPPETLTGVRRPPTATLLVAFGSIVADLIVELLEPAGGEKTRCLVELRPGGAAFNVIAAAQRYVASALVGLLGPDALADPVARMVSRSIPRSRLATAMPATRTSIILGGRCYTTRHPVTGSLPAPSIEAIRNAKVVVLSPLLGEDHDLAVSILAMAPWSLVMLSSDQLSHREKALDLMRRASLTQLNATEALQLTGQVDPIAAIQWLRSKGVDGILVTSKSGVMAFIEGEWVWQPAFAVTPSSPGDTPRAGDSFAGTMLAMRALDLDWTESIRLGAAAAASLVAEGRLPHGGLVGLREFADRTANQAPPLWLRPPLRVGYPRSFRYAGPGMAAAAALGLLSLLLN